MNDFEQINKSMNAIYDRENMTDKLEAVNKLEPNKKIVAFAIQNEKDVEILGSIALQASCSLSDNANSLVSALNLQVEALSKTNEQELVSSRTR